MRRILIMSMLLAVLAMPMLAMADDQTIPPEAQWSPTPPARPSVDVVRLTSLLVEKGMITPQEYAHLTRPEASSTSQEGHARVWTWDEIYNNPVTRIGGAGGN